MQHLSDAQLGLLADAIRDRHLALVVSIAGKDAVSAADLKRLQAKGLLPSNIINLPLRSYQFGLLASHLDTGALQSMSFNDFMERVVGGDVPDLTAEERAAIKAVQRGLSASIRGLGNRLDLKANKVLVEADHQLRRKLLGRIKKEVIAGIEKRKTIKDIAGALQQASADSARDWHRIASTEIHNAFLEGRAAAISARSKGGDPLVFKRPRPDGCAHCKRLYLEEDQITPRVFHLSEFMAAGTTNEGRKVGQWRPTLGCVHPFCQCVLHEMPPGFQFGPGGHMVYVGTGT